MTSHVFHRSSLAIPPVATAGHGLLIEADGKQYIDACGGAAVSCLGHGHQEVIEAMVAQTRKMAYAHTGFFTTDVAEELATHLIGSAPAGMDKVYFVSGGSEAMEAALKMARQYFLEKGEPQRHRFIARRQSYHGNTLGALAVGGNMWRREPFAPLMVEGHHVSPCYAYRDRQAGESDDAYADRLALELSDEIERLGPETVAAFCAETVVGATAGAVPPVEGYFQKIRAVCDRYGILLILDEVMCGMGRTGHFYACTEDGVVPDLVAIAKGLGGGYQPIGAVIVQKHIHDAIASGSGSFQHGHTYVGHAVACAAALAVQKIIARDDLLAQVRTHGDYLRERLTARFGNTPCVGDVRGRGFFQAIELVSDRTTKGPFDPVLKVHARIKKEAMARGLMVYPMGGTIDGRRGDHVLLAPPFIATRADIGTIVERLGEAVDAATRGLAA